MSTEYWKTFFEVGGVILLFLTFVFGAGALFTSSRINKEQAAKLRQFDKDMTSAKTDLGNAKAEMARQQTRAAIAERSLLELQEQIKPRHLTDQQSAAFLMALKAVPKGKIKFGYTAGGGDEAFKFLQQLVPLFGEGGWEVPSSSADFSNRFDIQVTGIAILVPGPPGSDPRAPAPSEIRLTPAREAIRSAFRAVGMDVQFQKWFPDQAEELIIGSKPGR